MKRVLVITTLAIAAGGCLGDGAAVTSRPSATTSTLSPVTTLPKFDPAEWGNANLVRVEAEGIEPLDTPLAVGSAPGFPVSDDGLILTAASAVVGATRVNVWLPGAEFPVAGSVEAEAACSNLALVSVDESANPVRIADSVPETAVWFEGRRINTAAYRPDGNYPSGSVILDPTGEVAGIWSGLVAGDGLIEGHRVASIVEAMRRRDLISELGVVAHDTGDGLLTVLAVDREADTGLLPGDIITRLGDGPPSLDALCSVQNLEGTHVEAMREGRRHIGTLTTELRLASARTQEQIRQAVVRIDTDYDGDGVAEWPTGTGFLISDDGKIVTNYHVIAGLPASGSVDIRIDGGDPIPATIIGRSSCNDLAVLDVAGTGYTYLEWSPDPLKLEMPVRSVGFPAGTATITFQSGQVSKEVATVYINSPLPTHFEHSAQIIGGNSGGPMLNEIGEVVGVTVSGVTFDEGGDEEYAIIGSEARSVVEQALDGDVETLGMLLDYQQGLFVVGDLDPEGPAAAAGLSVGDRIYRWGGLSIGEDGYSTRGFCREYLERSDGSGALEVAVNRFGVDFDGDFFGSITEVPPPEFVSDESGVVSGLLPGRWTDFQPIRPDETNDWVGFRAAPSVQKFLNEAFGTNPGARVLVSADEAARRTTDEVLAATDYGGCVDQGVEPVEPTPRLSGHVRTYTDCRGTRSGIRSYALLDTDQSIPVMVLVLFTETDFKMSTTEDLFFESLVVAPWGDSSEPGD